MKKHLLIAFVSILSSFSINAQCTNTFAYGNGVLTATTGSNDIIGCQYAEEFGTWDGIIASYSYTTTSSITSDFVTVRSGSSTGPVVAFGTQPLTWTATTTGTHYIHINTNASCGQESNCRDIVTTNNGPAFACTNPALGGTTQSNITTACPGQPFTLSLNGASAGSGLTYQWQSSTNGTVYADIVGATNSTYQATQAAMTYYQCIVTCSAGTQATSTPLMIDMGSCVVMNNGATTACSGNFYDSGAGTGNYMDNENYTFTITPSTPGTLLQVTFSSFLLETCCDDLTVYNGNSVAAPFMGSFATNPGSITSSATDGSLTFVFYSDGSVTYDGWAATLGCITAPLNDLVCNAINVPVNGSVNTYNNGGAGVEAGETAIAPPATGSNTTDGWGESTLSFTTWFTFTAPASGNVTISSTDIEFDGQIAIYEATTCSDFSSFNLVAANDDAMDFSSASPSFTVCGLTPSSTYYLMFDSGSTFASGAFSLALTPLTTNAGAFDAIVDVCSGETIDLFTGITGNDLGGTWYEMIPTVGLSGSDFNTAGLAYQVFAFEYVVVNGCSSDTSNAQVHIYGPSNAGNDGTLTVCRNQAFNLLDGLSGTVDLGGTWYNPSNQAIVGNTVTASNIPGQFNYDYITSNGVCPNDTANVLVEVQNCTVGLSEIQFTELKVYPNPTLGVFFISNEGSTELLSYEIMDLNGRIINAASNAINGAQATEVDLTGNQNGLYFVRVFNTNGEKTFRITLQ